MILFPRARRRKPGIYVYRTRRHLRRGTEWGYAGMSTNLPMRAKCHAGTCSHGCPEKGWYDLIVWKRELRLPWWLGWKWLLLSVETVVIAILRPRYNWQKNPRRSKVPARVQDLQRAARVAAAASGQELKLRASFLDLAVRSAAALLILTGLCGWWLTR